jgi:hypothetical protein
MIQQDASSKENTRNAMSTWHSKQPCTEDYTGIKPTMATLGHHHAVTEIKGEQLQISTASQAGLISREGEKPFNKMLNGIRDSRSNLENSDFQKFGKMRRMMKKIHCWAT